MNAWLGLVLSVLLSCCLFAGCGAATGCEFLGMIAACILLIGGAISVVAGIIAIFVDNGPDNSCNRAKPFGYDASAEARSLQAISKDDFLGLYLFYFLALVLMVSFLLTRKSAPHVILRVQAPPFEFASKFETSVDIDEEQQPSGGSTTPVMKGFEV